MTPTAFRALLTLLLGLVLAGAVGCASKSGATPDEAAAVSQPIPNSSPMAKVSEGMTGNEVRAVLGNPDAQHSYMTGKSWIPFYSSFGGDLSRTEWRYRGKGKLTFTNSRWSSQMKVIRIIYDPSEQGL